MQRLVCLQLIDLLLLHLEKQIFDRKIKLNVFCFLHLCGPPGTQFKYLGGKHESVLHAHVLPPTLQLLGILLFHYALSIVLPYLSGIN